MIRLEIWVNFDKDKVPELALEFEKALAKFTKENESKIRIQFSKVPVQISQIEAE